jgi:hypothetical protein
MLHSLSFEAYLMLRQSLRGSHGRRGSWVRRHAPGPVTPQHMDGVHLWPGDAAFHGPRQRLFDRAQLHHALRPLAGVLPDLPQERLAVVQLRPHLKVDE